MNAASRLFRVACALVAACVAACALPTYDPLGQREPQVVPTGCAGPADCPGGYCDVASGACLACRGNSDCVFPPGSCWAAQGTCVDGLRCVYEPRPTSATCDDANACSEVDMCDGSGACLPGAAISCDDHDPCTTDTCDGEKGCLHAVVADETSCGSLGEVCRAGKCRCGRATWESSCSDGTDNDCNSQADCADLTCEGQPCEDGDPCTSNETCRAGACTGGVEPVCDRPPGPCFQPVGFCSSESGACVYRVRPANTACDDRDPCTTGETCDGSGGCKARGQLVCPPGTAACHLPEGTCVTGVGCEYPPALEGTECDPHDVCAGPSKCDAAGTCVPGAPTCP